MFDLPISIYINDKEYPIRNRGDFRMVIDCFIALNDSELDKSYRIATALIIFYEGLDDGVDLNEFFDGNVETAVKEMFDFMTCGQPESPRSETLILYNWDKDAQLIAGAVNAVAGYELRGETYVHWWTFMGYFANIGDGSFSTIISIRYKIKKGKKLEKYEKEFKRDNPQYFVWESKTSEDIEAENYIRSLWNNGG